MPLAAQPRTLLAVLTCMDARIDPLSLLGLELGDAHIIRNAGGLVTQDAIRSLSASQRLLGTRRIALVMHSGCGLHGASDDQFNSLLVSDGVAPDWRLGSFRDVTEALRLGVARLRASRELPYRDDIQAFVFDTDSGVLQAPEFVEDVSE
jgi:carbonic anhydrase